MSDPDKPDLHRVYGSAADLMKSVVEHDLDLRESIIMLRDMVAVLLIATSADNEKGLDHFRNAVSKVLPLMKNHPSMQKPIEEMREYYIAQENKRGRL